MSIIDENVNTHLDVYLVLLWNKILSVNGSEMIIGNGDGE